MADRTDRDFVVITNDTCSKGTDTAAWRRGANFLDGRPGGGARYRRQARC